jgi:hypothetical protein
MGLASLPIPRLRFNEGEIAALVDDFRRTRDAHRGRYAAAVEELPAEPGRIATAIVRASNRADGPEQLRLAEDLVDLQGFVDLGGEAPPLPPGPGRAPSPVLELVRWRQAAAMHFIREDPSVVGDKVAQGGRWTPIGGARKALERTGKYRDDQAAGFVGLIVWIVAAPAGALIGSALGLGRVSLTVWIALVVLWWGSPILGVAWVRVLGPALERVARRFPRVSDAVVVLFLVPLVAVTAAIGMAVVAVAGWLGL